MLHSLLLLSVLGQQRLLFHDPAALPAPARLEAMSPEDRAERLRRAERWYTAKVLVRHPDRREKRPFAPLTVEPAPLAGWSIETYPDAKQAQRAAQWMASQGWEVSPLVARRRFRKQAMSTTRQREVNDPLFPKQWHLGADSLNLGAAWDYVTGKGTNIAVVDDGLEISHVDLKENAYPLDSGYHHNFNDGPAGDPTPALIEDHHGTACAGIVAARGFNSEGLAGIAPEARLMGLRLIAGPVTDEMEGQAFAWQPAGTTVHVSSNSWGPGDDGVDGGRQGPLAMAGLAKATRENRDGLGTVVVVSAGNGRKKGDNSSFDAYASSRFAIAVAAINRAGEPSSYSEEGMNVAISAYGGEYFPPDVIWTTNRSGAEANALLKEPGASEAPINYTDSFNGTSAAAPQVSGAVALLLERNPRLHYRDVKEILLTTARRTGLKGGDPFATNGGGFAFSHSFGAGVLNVAKALEAADGWKSLPALTDVSAQQTLELALPDEGTSEPIRFALPDSNLRVEHVEFTVTVTHPLRGDLSFELTSPSGMKSVATRRPNDDTQDFTAYTFTSVRHWGEASSGTWELRLTDSVANGAKGIVKAASLKIYGTAR